MKKKKEITEAGELGELRRALLEVEKLRFAMGVTAEESGRLESASVDLRIREREIIASMGEEFAAQIRASAISLTELSKRIKARTAKLSKLPKNLDKTSGVILEIIDIARRIEREF
ncbi:MAG: hypothetical protein ABFC28_07790 [Rikenellaceae bacterium]